MAGSQNIVNNSCWNVCCNRNFNQNQK